MEHSYTPGSDYSANNAKIAIISARFNGDIVEAMRTAAEQTLLKYGVQKSSILNVHVPGAFELPLVCKQYAKSGYDAVIALGCVIRGDTPHFDYVCNGAAMGIQQASLETGVPIAFGVLTTDTSEQALQRASIKDIETNKGKDAALCALEMINVLRTS